MNLIPSIHPTKVQLPESAIMKKAGSSSLVKIEGVESANGVLRL